MEEVTNVQGNETTAEVEPETANNSPSGQKGNEPEKKFTQADVDRIVKERLKRQADKDESESNAHFQQREAELLQKESRLACKEYLLDNRYPSELLDVINTSDFEEFKAKANTVLSVMKSMQTRPSAPLFRHSDGGEDVAAAFANTKHTPKKY